MSNTVKKVRQTCTCINCGNESEMEIICTLEDIHEHTEKAPSYEQAERKAEKQEVKGTATCTHCGNEAEMWVNI